MNVQERIINILSWATQVPVSQICPTTSFKDDLQLDEIDFITFILRIEKSFNIALTREEVENIETLKDLVDRISGNLNKYAA